MMGLLDSWRTSPHHKNNNDDNESFEPEEEERKSDELLRDATANLGHLEHNPASAAAAVQVSNLQASFAEQTAQEMKNIVDRYANHQGASSPEEEDDDEEETEFASGLLLRQDAPIDPTASLFSTTETALYKTAPCRTEGVSPASTANTTRSATPEPLPLVPPLVAEEPTSRADTELTAASAAAAIKVSTLQASFAEKTAAEMKQIVDWYATNQDEDRFTRVSQAECLPHNPLACVDADEDQAEEEDCSDNDETSVFGGPSVCEDYGDESSHSYSEGLGEPTLPQHHHIVVDGIPSEDGLPTFSGVLTIREDLFLDDDDHSDDEDESTDASTRLLGPDSALQSGAATPQWIAHSPARSRKSRSSAAPTSCSKEAQKQRQEVEDLLLATQNMAMIVHEYDRSSSKPDSSPCRRLFEDDEDPKTTPSVNAWSLAAARLLPLLMVLVAVSTGLERFRAQPQARAFHYQPPQPQCPLPPFYLLDFDEDLPSKEPRAAVPSNPPALSDADDWEEEEDDDDEPFFFLPSDSAGEDSSPAAPPTKQVMPPAYHRFPREYALSAAPVRLG